MTTTASPSRLLRQFGSPRTFLSSATLIPWLFLLSFLVTAFFDIPAWRRGLVGTIVPPWPYLLGLQAMLCASAWRYLLRRGFVWAEPAELTWADFSGRGRAATVSRRMWITWVTLMVIATYTGALLAAIYDASGPVWIAGGALTLGSGLFSLALVRRLRLPGWVPVAWPVTLGVLGIGIAMVGPPLPVVYGCAGLFLLAAAATWYGTGLWQAPVATAGRAELVRNWKGRVVRSVALSFLDLSMVLPEARPVGRWSMRSPMLVRLAWLGVVARVRYVVPAVLSAIVAAVALVALPAVPTVLPVLFSGYFAVLPLAGGLGELWHFAGRRRWLGSSDLAIRGAHIVVLACVCALFAGVIAAVHALLVGPSTAVLWWSAALVCAAVVRTVTRPPINYDVVAYVDTPFGLLPSGLVGQALRGPEIAIIGSWLLIAMPFGTVTWVVITLVIICGMVR